MMHLVSKLKRWDAKGVFFLFFLFRRSRSGLFRLWMNYETTGVQLSSKLDVDLNMHSEVRSLNLDKVTTYPKWDLMYVPLTAQADVLK